MTLPDHFDLENELRQALRRVDPAKDFSAVRYARRRGPVYGWLAVAAALVLTIAVPAYRARQQAREQAHAQLIQALRITQEKIQKTQQMVIRQLDRRDAI